MKRACGKRFNRPILGTAFVLLHTAASAQSAPFRHACSSTTDDPYLDCAKQA
jgi:hypothetical protein